MINLELYRIFIIVAEEKNLTKASNILHISQPAVSKHIKNLENQFNVKLFNRSKYGMFLTDNGKKLYLQINDSIKTLNKADFLFNVDRDINLGIHINMPNNIYSNQISKFYEQNKNSTINILKLITENMFFMLEKQQLDLVISKKFSENLYNSNLIKYINLGFLHDVFVVRNNSKYNNTLFSKKDLKKEKIYTLRNISGTTINLLNSLEISNESLNVKNITYSTLLELLKSEDIIAVLTKEYIKNELETNKLNILKTDFELDSIEFGFYYNVKNRFKELQMLISILKSDI
ncbi:MAG: LysR family transcriptional regulator [Clostridia bacterium]|nr:LysR family transcriptional regulator [Clostridia bacterium]